MKELSLLHIALIYLAVINVATFFVYGIDKWKAKKSKWRIRETALLGLAVLGGSIGAWFGMKVWHHKTLHKKFRYGVPVILIAQIVFFFLCSCRTASLSTLPSSQTEQSSISQVADKVWSFSQSHPNGFTLNIRTMTEPKEGIAVSYAATQNSHSRNQLDKMVDHAFQNNGYVGGWYNKEKNQCFGCCPENPIGLHMVFYEDGDYIVSNWHPEKNYQGWVNTMHGGILSTLIDEVCGWVVTRKLQTSGYTVQLNVKFRKAVPTTEPELTIKAKVAKQVRNLVYINAEITNSKGELCNEGEAVYFLMNQEKAKEMGFLHCDVEG